MCIWLLVRKWFWYVLLFIYFFLLEDNETETKKKNAKSYFSINLKSCLYCCFFCAFIQLHDRTYLESNQLRSSVCHRRTLLIRDHMCRGPSSQGDTDTPVGLHYRNRHLAIQLCNNTGQRRKYHDQSMRDPSNRLQMFC